MKHNIRPHHQNGINSLVKEYKKDPRFKALIIGGSVAKGCARTDSDVDFIMIATDEEYAKRLQTNDLFINRKDLTNYPNGFVDGKIINEEFLHQVLNKGNEPTRAAFDSAIIGFSKIEGLQDIVNKIVEYPENLRTEKLKTFYSMAFIQNWLMGEAERHNNFYTKHRAASQLVLFAGRLILAYNRIFFPYHKWFYEYLTRCPKKPLNLIDKMNQLLTEPNTNNAESLFQSIKEFEDWQVSDIEAFLWFMEDVEMSWLKGNRVIEDW
ncbi:nucleotidyltransferase domain-containing protein [Winogradskyella sp.]|uniref:nucleotidyltransferase domain-containing protein n=1 Tax=Winogradskyella sp. TaxID=1883156 RepID=UPI003BAC7485